MIKKILCNLGFHKLEDKSITVRRSGSIYYMPDETYFSGTECIREVESILRKCKRCGKMIETIVTNEDIHIGI